MMKRTVLTIDDKKNVLTLLDDYLTGQGFEVITAWDGYQAIEAFRRHEPDIILLDIMMPKMDGYQFIKNLRQKSNVPIIMLTAKRNERDIVRGFELGADDYIIKPFRMRELLMRMRAVLRRSTERDSADNMLQVGNLILNRYHREVRKNNLLLELTSLEFDLLELFMESAGRTLTRAALCIHLIERGYSGSESTLKIHVRNLRQKLDDDTTSSCIETIFGIGYRLRV